MESFKRLPSAQTYAFQADLVDQNWFWPEVCQIQSGYVCVKNILEEPLGSNRGAAFMEIRLAEAVLVENIKKVHTSYPDQNQYVPKKKKMCCEKTY